MKLHILFFPVSENIIILNTFHPLINQRPNFDSVEKVLRDLPDANGNEIDLFLKKYICKNPNVKSPTEKKKKEAFKKLVAGVISVRCLFLSEN